MHLSRKAKQAAGVNQKLADRPCRNSPTADSAAADGHPPYCRPEFQACTGGRRPNPGWRAVGPEEDIMLHYAVVFFVIALIAAVLGFSGIAAGAAGIAKVLFVVFLAMALLSFLANLVRRR
jgi:uncharacterized membrane protein YtjA (UPF0391 family)